ncbi:MAG: UDP-3-O-(3-hydroxymyristoyl)glucosamine N-acyltransferase [Ignavibacteria bacterium]|nr:UDP-3-O-(3-hydroxymyristoyl)glucosamine N-acyltransferase [Ignavibacteria bacterium]
MNLSELATFLGAELEGNGSIEVDRVDRIEHATSGAVSFIANPRYAKYLGNSQASAVIIARDLDISSLASRETPPALLRIADPYLAFLRVMARFNPPPDPLPPGVHPTAVVAQSARLGSGVRIGAHVVIGEQAVIGDDAVIGHNTVVCDRVVLDEKSIVYHNVTIREDCRIGKRVIVHSGTTIGADGFGFAPKQDGSYEKIPQLGIVVIEDDVEIGANCAVDRATMGETIIKRGTKLDNLIQVAHNVVLGEDIVIAAQSGISGSTKVGKGSMIGGQVGITGHLSIAERTRIGAQSGIHRSVTEPGQTLFGSPAMKQREAFRVQGALGQIPDLLETVRKLKQAITVLEERLDELRSETEPPSGNPRS